MLVFLFGSFERRDKNDNSKNCIVMELSILGTCSTHSTPRNSLCILLFMAATLLLVCNGYRRILSPHNPFDMNPRFTLLNVPRLRLLFMSKVVYAQLRSSERNSWHSCMYIKVYPVLCLQHLRFSSCSVPQRRYWAKSYRPAP